MNTMLNIYISSLESLITMHFEIASLSKSESRSHFLFPPTKRPSRDNCGDAEANSVFSSNGCHTNIPYFPDDRKDVAGAVIDSVNFELSKRAH